MNNILSRIFKQRYIFVLAILLILAACNIQPVSNVNINNQKINTVNKPDNTNNSFKKTFNTKYYDYLLDGRVLPTLTMFPDYSDMNEFITLGGQISGDFTKKYNYYFNYTSDIDGNLSYGYSKDDEKTDSIPFDANTKISFSLKYYRDTNSGILGKITKVIANLIISDQIASSKVVQLEFEIPVDKLLKLGNYNNVNLSLLHFQAECPHYGTGMFDNLGGGCEFPTYPPASENYHLNGQYFHDIFKDLTSNDGNNFLSIFNSNGGTISVEIKKGDEVKNGIKLGGIFSIKASSGIFNLNMDIPIKLSSLNLDVVNTNTETNLNVTSNLVTYYSNQEPGNRASYDSYWNLELKKNQDQLVCKEKDYAYFTGKNNKSISWDGRGGEYNEDSQEPAPYLADGEYTATLSSGYSGSNDGAVDTKTFTITNPAPVLDIVTKAPTATGGYYSFDLLSNSQAKWDFKVYSKTTGQEVEGNYCFAGSFVDGNMKKTITLTHGLSNDLYGVKLSLANRPNISKEVTIDLRRSTLLCGDNPVLLTPAQLLSLFTDPALGFGTLSTNTTIDQVTNSVLSLQNLDAKIADFTNQVNILNQELTSHGLNIQSFDENTTRKKIDKLRRSISASIAQKQTLVTDITTQLTDISTKTDGLVTQSNTLTGLSEIISEHSFSTFNEFKEEAESLNSDFDNLVESENTFGLVDASNTIAKETKLFKALTIKYINDLLPESVSNANELEQYRDDQDYFDKIQSPRTLIKWINHKIKAQKTKLSTNQAKLNQDFQNSLTEAFNKIKDIKDNIDFLEFVALVNSGHLNPDTLAFNDNGFTTQSFKFHTKSPVSDGFWDNNYQSWLNFKDSALWVEAKSHAAAIGVLSLAINKMNVDLLGGVLSTGEEALILEGAELVAPTSASELIIALFTDGAGKLLTNANKLEKLEHIVTKILSNPEIQKSHTLKKVFNKLKSLINNYKGKINKVDNACKSGKCPKNVLSSAARQTFTDYINNILTNPKNIWGKSPKEIAEYFESQGYKATTKQSERGSKKAVLIKLEGKNGEGLPINLIEVHPGGGTHKGSYYRFSTDGTVVKEGKLKIIDSTNGYDPRGEVGVKVLDINNFPSLH